MRIEPSRKHISAARTVASRPTVPTAPVPAAPRSPVSQQPRPAPQQGTSPPSPSSEAPARPRPVSVVFRPGSPMAPNAGSKLDRAVPSVLLLLLLLLRLVRTWEGRAETHCLSYIFTKTAGQLCCEVQGKIEEKIFLNGSYGNKNFKPCGPLGKEIYGTNVWKGQMETLINVVEELRKKLLDFQLENHILRGNITVEITMSCQREANGDINGFWQFCFNGEEFFVFHSKNRTWTLANPGAKHMIVNWENDMDVTSFFYNILAGDCKMLLTHFLTHWEKLLQPIAPPTEASGTAHVTARATRSICCTLNVLLTSLILLLILSRSCSAKPL
nr:NKG2D ligand 1-like [Microcebus murinus]